MIGVFGVIAYSVEQRVRDFGVRRALGATTQDVLRVVMGAAAPMIAIGAVIGLAMSLAAGRLLASLLFGVDRWTRRRRRRGTRARGDCRRVGNRSSVAGRPHRSCGRAALRVIDRSWCPSRIADPLTFALVASLLAVVSAVACAIGPCARLASIRCSSCATSSGQCGGGGTSVDRPTSRIFQTVFR